MSRTLMPRCDRPNFSHFPFVAQEGKKVAVGPRQDKVSTSDMNLDETQVACPAHPSPKKTETTRPGFYAAVRDPAFAGQAAWVLGPLGLA